MYVWLNGSDEGKNLLPKNAILHINFNPPLKAINDARTMHYSYEVYVFFYGVDNTNFKYLCLFRVA